METVLTPTVPTAGPLPPLPLWKKKYSVVQKRMNASTPKPVESHRLHHGYSLGVSSMTFGGKCDVKRGEMLGNSGVTELASGGASISAALVGLFLVVVLEEEVKIGSEMANKRDDAPFCSAMRRVNLIHDSNHSRDASIAFFSIIARDIGSVSRVGC